MSTTRFRPVVLSIAVAVLLAAGFAQAGQRGGGPAAGATPASPAAQGAPQTSAPPYPPVGNLAQLMRGVFFPNSNLIFTVQTHDPAAPAPPPSAGSTDKGFSFAAWGAGIYTGWQVIDNAAVALADVSPLMLAPGLTCENGRPAPVTDPDWIRFTDRMVEVSKEIYALSLKRDQEAVAAATGDLSDACAACHQAYRDVRRGGPPPDPSDPKAGALRCQSRR